MQLLLLLLLFSHLAVVTAVPGCHSDRDKDNRLRQNCTAAGFSDVPAGLELTTKVLLFPNNLFSSLSWSSFQTFTEIYEIDLTSNQVLRLPAAVSPVSSLSVLRLGWNRLSSLPEGSFSACPGLTELYLDNNAIATLSDHTFSALNKLEILDLSSNHISVLPQLMLRPLLTIETLYLENNKITVLPDDWFIQKEEVPYLFLSANPWACSCSLGYLRRYLDNYEYNVYVRDGPLIQSDVESVVCDSPEEQRGKAVVRLEESDLCSPPPTGDAATGPQHEPTTAAASANSMTTSASANANAMSLTASATATPPQAVPARTTSLVSPTAAVLVYTQHHSTVTWYHTFTRRIEWSHHSGSEVRGDGSGSHAMTSTKHTFAVDHASSATTSIPEPAETSLLPVSTKTTVVVVTPTPIPLPVTFDPTGSQRHRGIVVAGAGLFCLWLFAGCVLLCTASGVCTAVTLARLVSWYRTVYRPIRAKLDGRRKGGEEGVRLLMCSMRGQEEVQQEVGGAEGVMALYRSVLFISREGGEEEERGDGGGGERERVFIKLESAENGGETREEVAGRKEEERGVYRKTLHRVFSREEELEGWRDVTEACLAAEEGGMDGERRGGGGRGGGGGGGVSRKRYSVILREEREEAEQDRAEVEWVVGGWEVTRGGRGKGEEGEGPRSSWGEWLAHYLPSMPWEVATPPESEATQ
ncbi:hypothetical protein LDENG_00208450 [Lucifuga dentata]|nr:hypothetical protein LDENG_00208450 [Lucifuga dentata]